MYLSPSRRLLRCLEPSDTSAARPTLPPCPGKGKDCSFQAGPQPENAIKRCRSLSDPRGPCDRVPPSNPASALHTFPE